MLILALPCCNFCAAFSRNGPRINARLQGRQKNEMHLAGISVRGWSSERSGGAQAQSFADLGKSLTPTGATRAGNADGTIPAWTGGLHGTPPGWHQGDERPDPYAREKPLFSITSSNAARYADKLSAGTLGMLRTLPTFRADVYPTHRTFAAPQFIYDNAIANASRAHLTHDGQDVEGALVSVPFPIPHNGNEAIWNHILRWRGMGASRTMAIAITTPQGDYSIQKWIERIFLPYDIPGYPNDRRMDSMYWSEVVSRRVSRG